VNKVLVTGLLIFASLNAFSTCIAIYIAPNGHIYVAADSRRTFYLDSGKTMNETICKIHNVGDTWFAISGFDDGGLLKTANSALANGADCDAAIKIFGAAMTAKYQGLMDEAQKFQPEILHKFMDNGLAEVAFFDFVDKQPRVQDIQFKVSLKKGRPVISYEVLPVGYITVIGIAKDIDEARPGELPSRQTMLENPAVYVEDLVKLEARKQPQTVGEPIDLLELKPDGAVWLRKNEEVATIQ
jgi:hypothetical protein